MTKKKMSNAKMVAKWRKKGFGMFARTPGKTAYVVIVPKTVPVVIQIFEGETILVPWIDEKYEIEAKTLLCNSSYRVDKIEVLRRPSQIAVCGM